MKYTKPNGKEGTLIIGNYPIVTLSVARRKRDEAKALLLDNLDLMEEKKKAKIVAQRAALLFETVALEWHADMSRRWTEGNAKTVIAALVSSANAASTRPLSRKCSVGQIMRCPSSRS